ncbi:MAG: hypothetical protein FWG50_10025 [Kiritimatiellaeota bacterium]|nr:hypothetical protein [Kiritimatiellota bacterium]
MTTKRILLGLLLPFALGVCAQNAAWYKGNLHMHSYWSDGQAFPEEAVDYYRTNGYHFICLSDHNLLQTDAGNWQEVGGKKVKPEAAARYLAAYGGTADKKTEDGKDFIRLKTVGELKRQFDKDGAFLMIPGFEPSYKNNDRQVHMNAINVKSAWPYKHGKSVTETFALNAELAAAHGKEHGLDTLYMLNHPFWPYFDVQPDVLIDLPQIRFYELCNDGNRHKAHADWYSLEGFWDIANAFRISSGHPPVFGTATDDTHNYRNPRGVDAFRGWVCVRAPRLDCAAIVQAMNRGDFYSSTGIVLKDVRFDAKARALSVEVEPKDGEAYDITFTVTKAGFDKTTTPFDDPETDKKPARKGVKYSDAIGVAAKKVSGTSASYQMQPDDLYVRATVTSSTKMVKPMLCGPFVETAWTQPYGWQK